MRHSIYSKIHIHNWALDWTNTQYLGVGQEVSFPVKNWRYSSCLCGNLTSTNRRMGIPCHNLRTNQIQLEPHIRQGRNLDCAIILFLFQTIWYKIKYCSFSVALPSRLSSKKQNPLQSGFTGGRSEA